MVENSDVPIKSIELQLVRVETCGKFVLSDDYKKKKCSFVVAELLVFTNVFINVFQVVLKVTPEMPLRSRTSR